MCKLDGTKCDTCLEIQVITDAGMTLEFTYDPREQDNSVLKTWLFATDFVDGILVRGVGDTVWSSLTRQEWLDEVGNNL
jgi:hypothetical protein